MIAYEVRQIWCNLQVKLCDLCLSAWVWGTTKRALYKATYLYLYLMLVPVSETKPHTVNNSRNKEICSVMHSSETPTPPPCCCGTTNTSLIYLRQRRRYMFLPVFVCLSVCLLARLLKNVCIGLDEILRVDKCRDMDELINFWAWSWS